MTDKDTMASTILDLVSRQGEGTYWDFKLKHHDNTADLVHDVLCLANAEHSGRRYLVFGVNNETFEIVSILETEERRTQADIIALFRDNARKLFQSRYPDFHLREIQLEGKSLDVLVIEDRPHKPYYFVEPYAKGRRKVHAHHIYTRVGDTNTPISDSAPPHEIERMWRERFGLDKPPLERARMYLVDPGEWAAVSEDPTDGFPYYYHREFPEFTLTTSGTDSPYIARNEEWTRGEIARHNNSAGYYKLYYHQTLLNSTRFVSFDDHKKSMVAPDWEPLGAGRFYFYKADSIGYSFQRFLVSQEGQDYSESLRVRGESPIHDEARRFWPRGMKIPVLEAWELESFLDGQENEPRSWPGTDEAEQYQLFLRNQLDFEKWRQQRQRTE